MATFERKVLVEAFRVKTEWKSEVRYHDSEFKRKPRIGDWLVDPYESYAYSRIWPDELFRANFEPVGEEAEGLLNPPKEKTLYESEGHRVALVRNEGGIWLRFKSPEREECLNLCEVAAVRGLTNVRGPILREVLEDLADHLGLETPS